MYFGSLVVRSRSILPEVPSGRNVMQPCTPVQNSAHGTITRLRPIESNGGYITSIDGRSLLRGNFYRNKAQNIRHSPGHVRLKVCKQCSMYVNYVRRWTILDSSPRSPSRSVSYLSRFYSYLDLSISKKSKSKPTK